MTWAQRLELRSALLLCGGVCALALLAGSCTTDAARGVSEPTLGELELVVPSDLLPADLRLQDANNDNLDVVEHEGRVLFAFRTAPLPLRQP